MTAKQYKAAMKALGLSHKEAGEWLGVAPRTCQGWAIGDYPVPKAVAMLLRLMERYDLDVDDVF